MYDELVRCLRHCVDAPAHRGCAANCKYGKEHPLNYGCISVMMQEAADAIEKLSAIREEQKAQIILMAAEDKPRWIPVTERLPSNGTNVLVFEFGRVEQAYTTTYAADRSLCWVVINGGSYHRISDADCPIKWWMPLPEPPKGE